MNVLIVEDETVAAEYLSEILALAAPLAQVVAVTESVQQTVNWLQTHSLPDLILMDIHLSDGDSFRIFEAIDVSVPVIFTTAYDQHALQAFKVNSIDYLLKPVSVSDLRRALEKWQRLSQPEIGEYLKRLPQLMHSGCTVSARLLLPFKDQLIPVAISDIACFYTSGRGCLVLLRDGRSIPWRQTLEGVSRQLPSNSFIRANKQYIIARDYVQKLTVWFDNRLLVSLSVATPEPIYISKNKATEFKHWLTGN